MNSRIYDYSLPDLKLMGDAEGGHHPDWLTFTPDGKRVYVANAGIELGLSRRRRGRKEVMQIPVGHVPKRNTTLVMP